MRVPARFLLMCLTALGLSVAGCEESTTTPTNNTPNPGTGPQSQLGKSVEMGKDLRDQITGRDMAAGALADSISGGDSAVQIAGLTIPIPAAWSKVTPSNSMRLAQYEADNGEVVVVFSQAGGSVQENIDRWAGQVTQNGQPVTPEVRQTTVAGIPVSIVDLAGTYTDGMMSGSPTVKQSYAMKAAILDLGVTKTFIKMTGPISLVDDHAANFENMIEGIAKD